MPYADFRDLEFDRRLNRFDDLFTVDLLVSYVQWKLRGSRAAETGAHAPAPHHSGETMTLLAIPTGSEAAPVEDRSTEIA
jgi:hypothetical protein